VGFGSPPQFRQYNCPSPPQSRPLAAAILRDDRRKQRSGRAMLDSGNHLRPARPDAGTAAFIVLIAVFAIFMVALMALGDSSHLLSARQSETPTIGVGPS
jgi:hypothetical protein